VNDTDFADVTPNRAGLIYRV